jgi:hypothetical protein
MTLPPPVVLNEDANDHLAQARRNYRLYLQLRAGGEFTEWALTVLFYTAVHLVQAYAAQHGPWVPANHGERAEYIRERLGPVFHDYRDLQDRSEDVRYDLWTISEGELAEWHDRQFAHIAAYLGASRRGIRLVEAPGSMPDRP